MFPSWTNSVLVVPVRHTHLLIAISDFFECYIVKNILSLDLLPEPSVLVNLTETLQSFIVCTVLPHRLYLLLLGRRVALAWSFGLAFSRCLAWFLCYIERFVVAILFLITERSVLPCGLFSYELPAHTYTLLA